MRVRWVIMIPIVRVVRVTGLRPTALVYNRGQLRPHHAALGCVSHARVIA